MWVIDGDGVACIDGVGRWLGAFTCGSKWVGEGSCGSKWVREAEVAGW